MLGTGVVVGAGRPRARGGGAGGLVVIDASADDPPGGVGSCHLGDDGSPDHDPARAVDYYPGGAVAGGGGSGTRSGRDPGCDGLYGSDNDESPNNICGGVCCGFYVGICCVVGTAHHHKS